MTFNRQLTAFFLFAVFLCVTNVANANLRAHDVIIADSIQTPLNKLGEPLAINIALSSMGQDLVVALTPSRLNRAANQAGIKNEAIPYLYEGKVKGDINSWARISILNGQPSGYLFYYGKLLKLDHRSSMKNFNDTSQTPYVLYEPAASAGTSSMLRSLNYSSGFQAFGDTEHYAPTYKLSNDDQYRSAQNKSNSAQTRALVSNDSLGTSVTRAIRVGIVIDSLYNEAHKGRGLARALSIMNSVDAIYQAQLGTAVIVENIQVYGDPTTDPMRNSESSVSKLLHNFRTQRELDTSLPADLTLVHLFSGHQDPNRVIGLGWMNTACRLDGYDVSLSTPYPFDTLLAAHEIAHNLGALHDDNPLCLNPDEKRTNTLMWPELSGKSTSSFSACSIRDMQAAIDNECNQDNIDIAVRLRTTPTNDISARTVIVDVANKDLLQRSTEVFSVTQFPIGTKLENVSAACRVENAAVTCNHGTVRAQQIQSVRMRATLLNRSTENITSTIELVNATDVNEADNRAVVQLLTFDKQTGEAVAAESIRFDASDLYQENDTIGGSGSASMTSLSALLLLFLRIHLARFSRINVARIRHTK